MTAGQGGYASCNHFTSLSALDDVSGNGTAKMIVGTPTLHMANLWAQTIASLEANAT
jgi:hypothetical protein